MSQAGSKAGLGEYVDTASTIAKVLGTTAQAALTFGKPALAIANLVAVFYPPEAPVAAALSVAVPILQKIADNAPAVAKGLEQNKPLIEAVVDVGGAVLEPLHTLFEQAHGRMATGTHEIEQFVSQGPVGDVWRQSFFSPQDPRFTRDDPSSH